MWKEKCLDYVLNFNYLYNLWAIDYRDGENREETIRITLKKMFFYLIYLSVSTTVLLKMVHPLVFTYTSIVQGQFVDIDFTSSGRKGPIKFKDIRDHADFWTYLYSVAIPNLNCTKWYSPYYPIANTSKDDSKLLYENSLLGVPRWRELRVKKEKCQTYEPFKNFSIECYGSYSKYTALKDELLFDIPKVNSTSNSTKNSTSSKPKLKFDAFTNLTKSLTCFNYTEPETPFKYYGFVSTYDSGGYIQNLDKDVNKSLTIIKHLYAIWNVNRTTRAVFLDFTLYNANLNLFCICKLIFELPPSGGFITSSSFQTIKLMRYKDPEDFVILGLEYVYICFIIYFICQELRNVFYYKLRYWRFHWTYVNLFIIIGSIILIPFNSYKFLIIPQKIKELNENPKKFADMDYIVYWQSVTNHIEALLLFVSWIKLFQFLNMSRTMGQLGATLSRCAKDMFVFSIMFFIVFFGFAQMGYLLFGEQIDLFSTFGKSVMTLLMTILGDFDYYAIEKHNKILAPIFFTTYIILVFFILFNMFLAIITDTFLDVKNEIKAKRSELELSEFLLRLPRKLAILICPMFVARRFKTLRLSSEEMISKLRRILELCNFSNFEIKLFFQSYSIYDNKGIDENKVLNMLKEIKKYKLKPDEYGMKPEDNFSVESFLRQGERIEYLKGHVSQINEKLNKFAVVYRQQLENEMESKES